MQDDIRKVLDFWLDKVGPDRWYNPPEGLDEDITDRFAGLCLDARAGTCDGWCCDADGALALLILLDQFPRNVWRGSGGAFASDRYALRHAKLAINRGLDLRIKEPERQFFYLPLMHSEVLADQEQCVRQFMLKMPETGEMNLPHAIKHRDVIRRFGRFPSRNAALGRQDSDAELAYRADGGYMS